MQNQDSSIGAPAPRANTGATLYNNKIYIFGGHGGLNYARVAFNDLYCFDLETNTWEKIEPANNAPDGRGGHSLFANEDKLYVYGGWNSEMQYNNVLMFDLHTKEWSDPDIFNEIPRWNHSSVLVEAIPTWKFFVFGGECAEYQEGTARAFGQYVNSSCVLDLGTMKWNTFASDPESYKNIPPPREYAAMAYDKNKSRLVVSGGWNNGWYDDLYALNIGKIVGPDYAIMGSEPAMGQLSGNVPLKITGLGFSDVNIRVFFTQGNKPVDGPTKMTLEVPGTFISETELTCVTPNFEQFGPKECVIQLSIGGKDLTTTWINFNYFLNTRANKSLAFGPGLLQEVCVGTPVEFTIVARNDLGENRTSGLDNFQVKITRTLPIPEEELENEEYKQEVEEIPCEVADLDNGTYHCQYESAVEGPVDIHIMFEDDKGKMVPIRGSPYSATFLSNVKASDNKMTGGAMDRQIKKELERLLAHMQETKKDIITKDKDLKNVKVLLGVKENVEATFNHSDLITLQIDQLDESLKVFQAAKLSKDAQIKSLAKLNKEWTDLRKIAKDVKKEIAPLVAQENEKNKANIKHLEDNIVTFTQEMKKREFFQYKCGTQTALQKLDGVFIELRTFENDI